MEQAPEIKRPRTRGMKRELEQEIENIEKNETVEGLNESLRVSDRPEASVSHHGVLGISFQLSNN